MTGTYLQIVILITVFAVHSVKSDDTIDALKKILKELNAPTEDRYDPKQPYHSHSSHYKHGRPKHGRDSPNLMNVQTMNLFLKPNKREREEYEVNRMLRMNSENICDGTGRCGCSGPRCGSSNNRAVQEDDLADEVDRVVNEINEQLTTDDDELGNEANRANINNEHDKRHRDYGRKINKDDTDIERDEGDRLSSRDDEDLETLKKIDRDDDDDDDDEIKQSRNYDNDDDNDLERERRLVEIKNRDNTEDLLQSKTIKVNDNLDVVILDKSDLEILLRNQNVIDLTRNDVNRDAEDEEILEKVLSQFKKFATSESKSVGPHRSADTLTTEELFSLYEPVKQQLVRQVTNYVKNKKLFTTLNMKHLMPNDKKKLRLLKIKYRRGEIKDEALGKEIVNILFGEQSSAKVVPHTQNTNNFFVPKWIYDKMLNSISQSLRAQKRVLPLTYQQKERYYNKEKGKPIQKLVWRKNASEDTQRFGIPFDFEVHGLGQVAP